MSRFNRSPQKSHLKVLTEAQKRRYEKAKVAEQDRKRLHARKGRPPVAMIHGTMTDEHWALFDQMNKVK